MRLCLKLCFVLLLGFGFFCGCANFMNGSELKDELDKAVEIANSSEIGIEINLKNKNSGKISPTGVSKIKMGVPFEIELTVTSGFLFDGKFSVYDKSDGRPQKIDCPEECVKFDKKSEYTVGTGITNYVYEVTVLKKNISSILINPDITNLSVTTAPALHSLEIINRYEGSNLFDYFTVELTVEDGSCLEEMVEVRFLDETGKSYVTDGSGYMPYPATVSDIGNGLYHLYFDIDLRDKGPAISEGATFKIEATVKNDGKREDGKNFSASIMSDKMQTKYSYSRTQVKVFNRLNGWINMYPTGPYPPLAAKDYMNTEEGIANHSKTIRLIVLECDENGRDKNVDGQQMSIRYGFCQDKSQLDELQTDHIIPFYTAYDFENECAEIQRIASNAVQMLDFPQEQTYKIIDEVLEDWDMKTENYRLWIYNEIEGVYPNPVQVSEDEEMLLLDPLLEVMDKKYETEQSLLENVSAGMNQELNDNFLKYFHKGEMDCSIIEIPLPSRYDPYKDFYVKVDTDNGINGKKYDVFKFPAAPKIVYAKIENSELTYRLHLQSSDARPGIYRYVYNEYENKCKWDDHLRAEDDFVIPSEFVNNNLDYHFYLYSESSKNKTYLTNKGLECYFFQDSIDTIKYTVKKESEPLEKFPSTVKTEIHSDGLNSGTHTITMSLDNNAFSKYDQVFIKYKQDGNDIYVEPVKSSGSAVSFTVPTADFYVGKFEGLNKTCERKEFSYSLVGSKDGRAYTTEYKISKEDQRIEDNISPIVPEGFDFSDSSYLLTRNDLILDSTGSFLTLKGGFTDQGDGFLFDSDNNMEATIKFTGLNYTAYDEEFNVKFPVDKYLNIPVGHLKKGDYKVDVKIKDKRGNTGSFLTPEIAIFKVDRKKIPEGYKLLNPSGNNIELKFSDTGKGRYYIDFFDGSQWRSVDEGKVLKGESSQQKNLGKSGLVRVLVNEGYSEIGYNNTVSYPFYAHVPSEAVSERDYQLLKNSLRIYSDKPFFVHILQSETDYGRSIDDWENSQLLTKSYEKRTPVTEPVRPSEPDSMNYPDFDYWYEAYCEYLDSEEYKEYTKKYEEYREYIEFVKYESFFGSEINPVYVTENHSSSPYIYNFPWNKLTKKYAVAVITWADNKRYIVPIDMSLKD